MIRLAALLICLGTVTFGQTVSEDARAAAARLQEASVMLNQAQGARDRIAALSETVRAYEDGLSAVRDGIRHAARREDEITSELDVKRERVAQLLAVLQTTGQTPAPLLLAHPQGPLGVARSSMLVADVTPALQAEVETLREQLTEIQELQQIQQESARALNEGMSGAQRARAALGIAISQRGRLPQRFSEDPIQTALLVASTDTLEAFAQGLLDSIDIGATAVALEPTGTLPLPVSGPITQSFGEGAGLRPGVVIGAQPRSLVTTPVAATVLFRGPLLEYGNVMILEPGADVLFVIAGLAEMFGDPGQILPAGSPIGLLGGDQPSIDSILMQNNANASDTGLQPLYLEVRQGQTPVDPNAWFALE